MKKCPAGVSERPSKAINVHAIIQFGINCSAFNQSEASIYGSSIIRKEIALTELKLLCLAYYLNNIAFLSRNYRLIAALRKFDVLKTNFARKALAKL